MQLKQLLQDRVPPGVDEAAYVKASFLAAIAQGVFFTKRDFRSLKVTQIQPPICPGKTKSPVVSKQDAVKLLGTMQGLVLQFLVTHTLTKLPPRHLIP